MSNFPTKHVMNKEARKVLEFWFEESTAKKHFVKDEAFDNFIIDKYLAIYKKALNGELDKWAEYPEELLALIIIYDQFPRNIFRDNSESFATDLEALELARYAVRQGMDKKLPEDRHRSFMYMPFMHSEELNDQDEGVFLFSKLQGDSIRWMKAHRDIISRFGRFPHRNKMLRRTSTKEEREFLKQPGSKF